MKAATPPRSARRGQPCCSSGSSSKPSSKPLQHWRAIAALPAVPRPSQPVSALSALHSHTAAGRRCAPRCQAAVQTFEPHVDPTVLYTQLLVLSVTLGAAGYWWWALVPSARRTLAKEKRQGQLNQYLQDLQQSKDRKLERWFYTDWLQQLQRRQQLAQIAEQKRAAAAAAGSAPASTEEHPSPQQQTGALSEASREPVATQTAVAPSPSGQQQQQLQLQLQQDSEQQEADADREPFFWSLDNPIVATAVGITLVAVVSMLLHGN